MGSVNKVFLIGNLGKDAELRVTPGGQPVSTFRIATTESWSKDGDRQEKTEWHNVVLWGKPAEALKDYLTKGKQICVEGRLQTRSWDKEGQKHYMTEIKADRITLLGGGGGGGRSMDRGASGPGGDDTPMEPITDDDIPF